jgi:hypothetical protein
VVTIDAEYFTGSAGLNQKGAYGNERIDEQCVEIYINCQRGGFSHKRTDEGQVAESGWNR